VEMKNVLKDMEVNSIETLFSLSCEGDFIKTN